MAKARGGLCQAEARVECVCVCVWSGASGFENLLSRTRGWSSHQSSAQSVARNACAQTQSRSARSCERDRRRCGLWQG